MARQPKGGPPPGGPPPDKSQQLLDAVNNLAASVHGLNENLPRLVQQLDAVTRQFAILIAMEADKRDMSVQGFVTQALMRLGEHAFGGKKGGR
jgi:hypothetical protein